MSRQPKQITFYSQSGMPALCPECGQWIEDGDECYYHGDDVYTCSEDCAKDYEK